MRDEKDDRVEVSASANEKEDGKEADGGEKESEALESSPRQEAPQVGTKVFLARGKGGDTLKQKKELQATVDKAGRCIKILEQFDRLAQKEKIEIPAAKLTSLTAKRNDGSITGTTCPLV